MVTEIGNILKSFLEPLEIGGAGSNQFIDKLAGVVKVITTTGVDGNNKSILKTFPVACGMSYADFVKTGKYKDLCPDSNIGCMVYFEDLGARMLGEVGSRRKWKASYRLVCWINQKKLGTNECSISAKILNTFLNKIPQVPFNSGIYQRCSIDILGQDPKSYNPFSKFSYDEDKTQYLMYPYDYFSIQLDFNAEVDRRCADDFIKQTEITCNN